MRGAWVLLNALVHILELSLNDKANEFKTFLKCMQIETKIHQNITSPVIK